MKKTDSSIYFVVSLPRTGTNSIKVMAEMCGLRAVHNASNEFEHYFSKKRKYNFFSDTPAYCPSLVELVCKVHETKFIYIDRDFKETFDSWVNVKLYDDYKRHYEQYHNSRETMYEDCLIEFQFFNEAFGDKFLDESNYMEIFQAHKDKVLSTIQNSKKDLLIYNFNEGWGPFCEFVSSDIPNEQIPHLNKNMIISY